MTSKSLTAVAVKNYRASAKRREIPDGGAVGLRLVIQPSGHKSWAMRLRRPNGATAKLTLGPLDISGTESATAPVVGQPLTLASARRLAADIHHQRATGRDVVGDLAAAKRRQQFEQSARATNTFGQAARDFIEGYAKTKTRRWQDQARMLGLGVRGGLADRWVDKPVADIDGHDIYTLIEEVRLRGVPGTVRRSDGPTEVLARNMHACLSKMFGWLQQHRRIEANPCAGVHKPVAPEARDRVLTNAEIVKFWRACDAERKEVRNLLKLLLLTGCRVGEVSGMRRSELDGATWTIPKERTKNKRPHVVPLAPQAKEFLIEGDTALVFTTDGTARITVGDKIKKRLDARMGNPPPWRLHDIRRTAATGMASIGIAPHIIEACLNHISGAMASVAGIYNRHQYEAEKKAALQRWADHVEGLVSGTKSKVVPIRRGKAS